MATLKLTVQSLATGAILLDTAPMEFEELLVAGNKTVKDILDQIIRSNFVSFTTDQHTVVCIHSDVLKQCILTFEEVTL